MQKNSTHKAGFVNIIGKPNAGKSTLMNALMGEKLSIITYKAQTTRHRIMGIMSGDDFQIVYSDTPGYIEPKYELQKTMMSFVQESLEDADILLLVIDPQDTFDDQGLLEKIRQSSTPLLIVLNKIDLLEQAKVFALLEEWQQAFPQAEIIPLSALQQFNIEKLFERIMALLPEHPAYFDKEEMTDKSERFLAAEMIREQIFLNYEQEIPYSTDVQITTFKEYTDQIHIHAEIFVERDSQKGIIIGKKGEALKKVGTEARKSMEEFFKKKVFLEQHVKVEPDWRKNKQKLQRLGYHG